MRSPAKDAVLSSRALGFATGWLLLGLINALSRALWLPDAEQGSVRLVHHAVDLGRHAAAALVVFTAALAWGTWTHSRFGPSPRRAHALATAAVALVSVSLALVLVSDDVAGMAERAAESTGLPAGLLQSTLAVAIGLAVPAVTALGPWFTRGPWRAVPVLIFAISFWANVTVSPRDNHGLHLYLSWFGATLLGYGCRWPHEATGWVTERRRLLGLAGVPCGALAFVGLALPLSNSQRVDLTLWNANLLPELTLGRAAHGDRRATRSENPFFAPRTQVADLPPRSHGLLPTDGVVLLLCIDGVRADVIHPDNAQWFPNLYRLHTTGTRFSNARSPGSATVYTLSALSTGQTFSQRYWSKTKGDYWPFEDTALHFPALLSEAGVATLHARSTSWLENERRIMSGFQEDHFPKKDWKWARGKDLAKTLVEMLEQHRSGPVFAFTHFLDTHHPYWPGRNKGKTSFERYLHALQYVDKQVGRVLDAVEELGMADRVVVIATADHGEAFGEHGTHAHATTLYEEQVRVPLIFWGPTIPAQERTELVTLLDLGPTLLELFGQPTPGQFLGESLVPLLQQKPATFQRPVIAEARLLQSMVFDDGIKVIRDRKSGVVEVYDLRTDPEEKHNLSDREPERLDPYVGALEEFFETHTLKRKGYRVPLRK